VRNLIGHSVLSHYTISINFLSTVIIHIVDSFRDTYDMFYVPI